MVPLVAAKVPPPLARLGEGFVDPALADRVERLADVPERVRVVEDEVRQRVAVAALGAGAERRGVVIAGDVSLAADQRDDPFGLLRRVHRGYRQRGGDRPTR